MAELDFVDRLTTEPRFYFNALWTELDLHKVHPLRDIDYDIIDWLTCGPALSVSLAPRGYGKTTIISGLVCYRLLRQYDRKILVVSKSDKHAKAIVGMIRQWIDRVWFLKCLKPKDDAIDNDHDFCCNGHDGDKQPSVRAIGVGGQLEGNRAHTIIPDDIETKGNTKTLESRAELLRLCNEFVNIRYVSPEAKKLLDPVEIRYVGTIKHEETIYNKLIGQTFKCRTWPIAYPAHDEEVLALAPLVRKHLDDDKAKPGQPLIPHRFDAQEIALRQAQGRHEYLMENMLIANIGDALRYPLRLADIMVHECNRDQAPAQLAYAERSGDQSNRVQDIPSIGFGTDGFFRPAMVSPTWLKYHQTVMRIDPAGRGADKLGYAIVGTLNGFFWVKACGGLHGGPSDDNLNSLAVLACRHNARICRIESNFGGEAIAKLVSIHFNRAAAMPSINLFGDNWGCSVEPIHASVQKERRIIAALDPVMSSHRLIFDPTVARHEELQRQITRLTTERNCLGHDDEIDALAGAIQDCLDTLAIDPAKNTAEQAVDAVWQEWEDRKMAKHGNRWQRPKARFIDIW